MVKTSRSIFKRVVVLMLVLMLVLPTTLSPIVYAVDENSSSNSSDVAGTESENKPLDKEVIAPDAAQTDKLTQLVKDIDVYTNTSPNPEMLTVTYLKILVTIYTNGFNEDGSVKADSVYGQSWNTTVSSTSSPNSAKSWSEIYREVFGDGGEYPGTFYDIKTSPMLELYSGLSGVTIDHRQAFGDFSWVDFGKTWEEKQTYFQNMNSKDIDLGWYKQLFNAEEVDTIVNIMSSSGNTLGSAMDYVSFKDSLPVQIYIWQLMNALKRYQMMYIVGLNNETYPCPFRYEESKLFTGNVGETIKAENLDVNHEFTKKIFGITGEITDDQKVGFDNLGLKIHSKEEYCTEDCFKALGYFTEGSNPAEYAIEMQVSQANSSNKGAVANIVKFVEESNDIIQQATKRTALPSDVNKCGEFTFPQGIADKIVDGIKSALKKATQFIVKELTFGLVKFDPDFAYASGVVTYYRWLGKAMEANAEDMLDGTSNKKEEDRRIGLGPELIYNFIARSDDDVRYRMKENVLTGIACSALFRPLQTNINDFDFKAITESPNFLMFQNKYGSLRKALLISDTSDSVAQYFRTGKINNLRVATLSDLITNVNTDKLLIAQDTYYNIDSADYTMTAEDVIKNKDYNFTTLTELVAEGVNNLNEEAKKADEEKSKSSSSTSDSSTSSVSSSVDSSSAESSSKTDEERIAEDVSSSSSSSSKVETKDETGDAAKADSDGSDNGGEEVKAKADLGEDDATPLSGKFNKHFQEWKSRQFSFESDAQKYSVTVASSKTFQTFINDQVYDDSINMSGVTPFSGLSVILSIMKQKELADTLSNANYATSPIYMSSSRDIDDIDDTVYYNNLMLKNISKNAPIRYSSALDLQSPLFVDIYGNILTESGVVVIPIAANASMANCVYDANQRSHANTVNWLTVANLLFYGDAEYIRRDQDQNPSISNHPVDLAKTSYLDVGQYLPSTPKEGDTNIYIYDSELERYYLNPVIVPVTAGNFSANLNVAALNSGDKEVMQALYRVNRAVYDRDISDTIALNFPKWFASIFYQVIKGAKMSDIDYEKEGIIAPKKFSNGTLAQAAKFEEFHENVVMENSNSLLSIPNLLYTEGFEYLIFLAFRLMTIVTVVALIIQIYQQAVKSRLNLLTFLKVLLNMILVLSIVFLVPMCFDVTYYQTNKLLLQDEALVVSALNAEKRNSGVELGISRASRVDSVSEVYITIDEIDVNWYDYLRDLLADPQIMKMQDLYKRYMDTLPTASESFELKGNKVYLDVEELFNSSIVLTDFNTHKMRQIVNPNPDASFYLPYYAIVDYMIYNINQFNTTVDSYNYDKYFYGDGRLRSVGLVKSYLLSDAFLITSKDISDPFFTIPENVNELTLEMAGYDKVGMNQFYNNVAADTRSIFSSTSGFESSQWYVEKTPQELRNICTNLDREAIEFVLNNEELIGRVSDETFIKMFALHMSLKYNKEFRCGGPQYLEIFNFNNEDISRLTTVRTSEVMQSSPYSYPKFVLENIGLVGVYVAAILDFIILAGSFIKPVATVFIFIAMLLSIFVYKCLLHKHTDNLKGLAILTILLCLGNLAYAVMIKFCIMLPNAGIPPLVCLLLQIVFQYAYIAFYLYLAITVLRNWKDLGAGTFTNIANMKTVKMKDVTVDDFKIRKEAKIHPGTDEEQHRSSAQTGWDLYDEMHRRDQATYVEEEDSDEY